MTDAKTREANRERQKKYREAHRDEINEQRRARYNNRISNGKCPRCGGKIKKGYTLCADCCEYQAVLNKKYAKERRKSATKAKPAVKAKAKTVKAPAKAKAAIKPKAKPVVKKAKPKAKK
jgi:hypothetical protein